MARRGLWLAPSPLEPLERGHYAHYLSCGRRERRIVCSDRDARTVQAKNLAQPLARMGCAENPDSPARKIIGLGDASGC